MFQLEKKQGWAQLRILTKDCDMVFSTTEKFNLKSAIVVESYHRLLSVIVTNSYALSLEKTLISPLGCFR